MKKILSIICGMAAAVSATAYTPMLVDGYQWNEFHGNDYKQPGSTEMVFKTYKRMVKGDSVVNGVTYKKILSTSNEDGDNWGFMCLMREDVEAQRVYRRDDEVGESLLYDFSVSEGDTIKNIHHSHLFKNYHFVVKKSDTFTDKLGRELKRLTGVIIEDDQVLDGDREWVLMERYGCHDGFTSYNDAGIRGGVGGSLLCAYDADEKLVYEAPYLNESDVVDSCFVWKTIPLSNPVVSDNQSVVAYNHLTREVTVTSAVHTTAAIYDLNGRELRTVTLTAPTTTISASGLPAGVYIVKMRDEAGNSEHRKIIIQ